MIVALVVVLVGIGVLAWSADQFVIGAARVALIRKVPALVVGMVIVGFGTSAPEMLVSALAAAGGDTEVAIGNVLGSNLANLSLLLGAGAILTPLVVESTVVRREAPLVVLAVAAFAVAVQGGVDRVEGLLLLLAMVVALVVVLRPRQAVPTDDAIGSDVVELVSPETHRLRVEVVRTLIGIIGTVGAAQMLLWGALDLADRAGLSEGFVGATLVAVGTSLPELVTVVQSARRGETDLIVGNLLGSNLFNALAVGGLIGLIGGPAIDDPALTTTAALASVVVVLLAGIAMWSDHTVTRREGAVLVAAYLAVTPFLL